MNNQYLANYLIDHLAGSVAALELLENLEAVYSDTALAPFFAELKTDIAADRDELQTLMDRLQIVQSQRKAITWPSEKSVELKLRLDDNARGPLRLLESLEAVELGI